jgi:hypothetical protein
MIDELVKQIASLQAENARPREKIKELETTRQGVNYQELLEELLRLFYVDGDGHLQWSFSECADHPVFTNLGSVVEQELIKNHDSRNNGCIMHTENHDREPEEGDIVAWRHPACSSGLWMVESYDPCWNKKEGEDWVILMRRDEVAKRIADSKPIGPGLANGIPAVPISVMIASLPKPFRKWWLATRPVKDAVQIDGQGIPPVVEFYVPWWAWPIEAVHRLVFGYPELQQ